MSCFHFVKLHLRSLAGWPICIDMEYSWSSLAHLHSVTGALEEDTYDTSKRNSCTLSRFHLLSFWHFSHRTLLRNFKKEQNIYIYIFLKRFLWPEQRIINRLESETGRWSTHKKIPINFSAKVFFFLSFTSFSPSSAVSCSSFNAVKWALVFLIAYVIFSRPLPKGIKNYTVK